MTPTTMHALALCCFFIGGGLSGIGLRMLWHDLRKN